MTPLTERQKKRLGPRLVFMLEHPKEWQAEQDWLWDRGRYDRAARVAADFAAMSEEYLTWIYYIRRADGTGPVKIGKAVNLKKRLGGLQVGSPYPLELIAAERSGEGLEWFRHIEFEKDRLHGEWFRPSPELWERIAKVRDAANLAVGERWPV